MVVATDVRYWRQQLGSQQRIFAMLSFLRNNDIDIKVFFLGELDSADSDAISRHSFDVVPASAMEVKPTLGTHWRRLVNKVRISLDKVLGMAVAYISSSTIDDTPCLAQLVNPKREDAFVRFIRQQQPDILLMQYLRTSYLAERLLKRVDKSFLLCIDTHDIQYIRYQRFIQQGSKANLRITQAEEHRVLKHYDLVLAIQQQDYRQYCDLGLENVLYVPHAVTVKPQAEPQSSKVSIGFIGSSMTANVHGITQFVKNIWPRLASDRFELNIYGNVCQQLDFDDPTITLHGFAEQLEDCYRNNHIIINPIELGSGLKIKSVEALCFGRALLTTPTGVEGMPITDEVPFLICDSDEQWLNGIEALACHDYRLEMQQRAIRYGQSNYSTQAAFGGLLEKLHRPLHEAGN